MEDCGKQSKKVCNFLGIEAFQRIRRRRKNIVYIIEKCRGNLYSVFEIGKQSVGPSMSWPSVHIHCSTLPSYSQAKFLKVDPRIEAKLPGSNRSKTIKHCSFISSCSSSQTFVRVQVQSYLGGCGLGWVDIHTCPPSASLLYSLWILHPITKEQQCTLRNFLGVLCIDHHRGHSILHAGNDRSANYSTLRKAKLQ